jgi:hypothetical protein
MDALINMGAEKYPQAQKAITRALSLDSENSEYVGLKNMIEKQIK